MHGNQFTIDDNDNVVPYVDKPMTILAAQRQMNATDALLLVLSRPLQNKPNENTMISSFLRRPLMLPP
jgi:hypothetical protein